MNVNSIFRYDSNTHSLKLLEPSSKPEEIKTSLAAIPREIIDNIHEVDLSNAFLMKALPSELNQFKQIKVLKIERCHALESLEGVQHLGISSLFASRCPNIANIDAIQGKQIKVLDLSFNLGIESLNSLPSLANTLQELYLEGLPKLQTTRRLMSLKNLRVLNIKDTSIIDTSSLSFIPKIIV